MARFRGCHSQKPWVRRCRPFIPSMLQVSIPTHPVALHICFEVVHVPVHQAPCYNNLRAIIEVGVTVSGEVQDGILRVLHLHISQEWVSYLLIEAL